MVTIDCADPARLTTFWTAALSTRIQLDHGEFVMLAAPGELGATELDRQRVPGLRWTVLADPEGNEFCVGQAEPRG